MDTLGAAPHHRATLSGSAGRHWQTTTYTAQRKRSSAS